MRTPFLASLYEYHSKVSQQLVLHFFEAIVMKSNPLNMFQDGIEVISTNETK